MAWFMQERFPSLVQRVRLAVLLTNSPLMDMKSKDNMRKPAAHDRMSHCPGGLRFAWHGSGKKQGLETSVMKTNKTSESQQQSTKCSNNLFYMSKVIVFSLKCSF